MQHANEKIYSEITTCRLCFSDDLQDVLDLGSQPPANNLRANLSELEQVAPLKLVHCGKCSVVQLTTTLEPAYLFSQYVWVTGTSATARGYSEVYCKEVLSRSKIQAPFVLEIASNDGTFLRKFKERGCEILGVDPAKNIAIKASNTGIPTFAEFFDVTIVKKILTEHRKPDIVMARNVIPHVKDIHSIVEGMSEIVNDEGIVVIEFHYAKTIVEELHYDSVYHEHLFYFSIQSLSTLFVRYGLHPFDVFASPISGGSLVLFFSKRKKDQTIALRGLIEVEQKSSLNELSAWQQFGAKSRQHADNLKDIVKKYSNSRELIAYGASARSSTLMNFVGISSDEIGYVIDRSPLKHNLYTPGTNIHIVSYEEGIKRLGNNDILLLAWNFEEEIVKDLRAIGFDGDIIVPLPNEVHIR